MSESNLQKIYRKENKQTKNLLKFQQDFVETFMICGFTAKNQLYKL